MDAADWDRRYSASDTVWSLTPNQFVASECAALTPGRAVDLAAGEGRNAIWLAAQGWAVTAVDFSTVAIERGRSRDPQGRVDWVVDDALTAPLPDVDLALICYLQLPGDQRRAVVRRAFDALSPGGTLLFVAHDLTNLTEGTGGPQDAAVLCTADDVLGDLRADSSNSMVVESAGRVARVVSTPDTHAHRGEPSRTAWDTLVRVRRAS